MAHPTCGPEYDIPGCFACHGRCPGPLIMCLPLGFVPQEGHQRWSEPARVWWSSSSCVQLLHLGPARICQHIMHVQSLNSQPGILCLLRSAGYTLLKDPWHSAAAASDVSLAANPRQCPDAPRGRLGGSNWLNFAPSLAATSPHTSRPPS